MFLQLKKKTKCPETNMVWSSGAKDCDRGKCSAFRMKAVGADWMHCGKVQCIVGNSSTLWSEAVMHLGHKQRHALKAKTVHQGPKQWTSIWLAGLHGVVFCLGVNAQCEWNVAKTGSCAHFSVTGK